MTVSELYKRLRYYVETAPNALVTMMTPDMIFGEHRVIRVEDMVGLRTNNLANTLSLVLTPRLEIDEKDMTYITITGRRIKKTQNGRWVDAKTGKFVPKQEYENLVKSDE